MYDASTTVKRTLVRAGAMALVCALAAAAVGVSPALAKPGQDRVKPTAGEPGWPESHYAENDPQPGDAGFIGDGLPVAEPPQGMSDDELRLSDPAAYAAIVPERAAIERGLLMNVRAALKASGVTPAGEQALSASDLKRAVSALGASPYSPYGYLRFTLRPNSTSPYSRNGYLGTLYFVYGIYYPSIDSYRWFTVSWPALSGNNRPYDQGRVGSGPIPAYTWDYGFLYGAWRGYEGDGSASFYPGKWRLDPWTGGPYGRAYLEVHGGSGSHQFVATNGCIRLYPGSISSLNSYYAYKMANKYDRSTAHLTVSY